jgi:hypothetical protein
MAKVRNKIPRIFITGIPTAGKSHLARKLIGETGGYCLETDNLRDELAKDPAYMKWARFFQEENEYAYYTENDQEKQWALLLEHHEKLWPGVLERIRAYEAGDIPLRSRLASVLRAPRARRRPLIFEGINILPHLAHANLDFPGIVLVGKSLEEVLRRNREEPRWGRTEKMIELGARAFWFVERPHYIQEAERYGYPIFEDADEAFQAALEMLRPE